MIFFGGGLLRASSHLVLVVSKWAFPTSFIPWDAELEDHPIGLVALFSWLYDVSERD